MKTNKKQKQRISKLQNEDNTNAWYGLYCFFDEYEMDVNQALEDFVTDRFLIPENGEVETIINTPESYFNMLLDFLEYLDRYQDRVAKNK
jgi:hypothetical protein